MSLLLPLASDTGRLGHSWTVQVGQFWRAPKSQDQMVQHLLCLACEDLLNKNGERWVLLNNYRLAGPSLLPQALNAATAEPEYPSGTVYSSPAVPGADIDKLIYFGASIFWRASMADCSRAVPLIGLGCTYDEQFRQHLHGEAEFPRNAILWVAVVRSEEPPPLVNFPVGEIEAKHHQHHFDIFGLSYMLLRGRQPSVRRDKILMSEPQSD